MREYFNFEKAKDAICYLLDKNGGRLNYTALIKLLYIADREHLGKWDATITGDAYCSMKNGPVLSKVYNIIKGSTQENKELCNRYFLIDEYDLVKNCTTNYERLSKSEIDVLEAVDSEFKGKEYTWLIQHTHNKDLFPEVEWESVEGSSKPIKLETILAALGRNAKEIADITSELESQEKDRRFFSSYSA